MIGIVADINMIGQVRDLVRFLLRTADYRDYWDDYGFRLATFAELGLTRESSDRDIWTACQAHGLILVTENRNHDGPDSLEAMVLAAGFTALPVVTVSDKDALATDRLYAESVAIDLLEVLVDTIEWDRYRGAGRVYLPLPRAIPEAGR
ncbi:MAG: hypothetical protein ACRC7O_00530 [Fimbriiglobus sp.]